MSSWDAYADGYEAGRGDKLCGRISLYALACANDGAKLAEYARGYSLGHFETRPLSR